MGVDGLVVLCDSDILLFVFLVSHFWAVGATYVVSFSTAKNALDLVRGERPLSGGAGHQYSAWLSIWYRCGVKVVGGW